MGCYDTIASSYLKLISKKAGAAANKANLRKEKLYEDIFTKHYFQKLFVKKLGPILNSKSDSKSENVQNETFFVNKISLEKQRGNVAGILGTIPLTAKI